MSIYAVYVLLLLYYQILVKTCISSGLVISQAMNEGFRFRNIDEITERRAEANNHPQDTIRSPRAQDNNMSPTNRDEKSSEEYIKDV